ncbi:ABC transporter permease [Mollicutes bacterium LVI A0039]|nr:ABC transporter permease [Mollicutes bacterium LVI A0039]
MQRLRRIYAVCINEFHNIKRDPVALRIPFVMPIVWLILLMPTFVINPTNLALNIDDQINNQYSTTIIDVLNENENIIIDDDATNKIEINAEGLTFYFDSSDYLNSRALEYEIKSSLAQSSNSLDFNTIASYEGVNGTDVFVILGMIGLVIQNILVFLSSISIVKERENGTIDHLLFSPVKYNEIIIGKLIPYFIIGLIDAVILVILSHYMYNITLTNLFMYFLIVTLFILSCLTLGLFISSVSTNQMQALLYTVFLLLPSILLSGFAFPIASMPKFIQVLSNFIPLKHFNIISRELIINNAVFTELIPNIVMLLAIILCSGAMAVVMLRLSKYKHSM